MAKSRRAEVEQAQREAHVIGLRKRGYTFEAIATRLGYADKSGAYQAFKRAMRETLAEPAAELRQMEVMRLDDLLLVWWPKAMMGSKLALDAVLKIMIRRAKFLGLDASDMLRYQSPPGLVAEIERLAAELGIAIDDKTD